MKIVFFGLEKGKQAHFAEITSGAEVSFFEENLNKNSVENAKDADAVCVFVGCTVNKDVIDAMPNLKLIATRSTGYDHIDYEYAKSKGIKVASVPGYGSHTVAEFAFGLILSLARHIVRGSNHVRGTSDFNYDSQMEGFELLGKVLGVVGTGRIGKNVIKIAKGFGMSVIAYDPFPDQTFLKENNFEYKTLDEVISSADVITLHAPYTKENYYMINKEKVSKMKKGVYLINTARGELIDTTALIYGLKEGIIAGAGLDVLEKERALKENSATEQEVIAEDHELMKMPNVIITPHIAFFTQEAVAEIEKITIDNLKAFLAGALVNVIN